MGSFWSFLAKPVNQKTLSWLGGGAVVLIAGLWAVFVYLFPPKNGDSPGPQIKIDAGAKAGDCANTGSVINSPVTCNFGLTDTQLKQVMEAAVTGATEPLTRQIIAISKTLDVTQDAVKDFLRVVGQKENIPDNKLAETLTKVADEYKRLQAQSAAEKTDQILKQSDSSISNNTLIRNEISNKFNNLLKTLNLIALDSNSRLGVGDVIRLDDEAKTLLASSSVAFPGLQTYSTLIVIPPIPPSNDVHLRCENATKTYASESAFSSSMMKVAREFVGDGTVAIVSAIVRCGNLVVDQGKNHLEVEDVPLGFTPLYISAKISSAQ
jgi:hypothetical protein